MQTIYFNDLLNTDTFIQNVESAVANHGAVCLKHLTSEQSDYLLSKLSGCLGTVSLDDVITPDSNFFDYAHRVEAKKEPSVDQHGFLILSTTTLEIPCHTDDYFSPRPADLILFQCVSQDILGGYSIIASLKEVLKRLDDFTTDSLKKLWYPAHFGDVRILTERERVFIRYNRSEIERACLTRNISLSQFQQTCLNELDQAIQSSLIVFKLSLNDILIVNNKTALHGRTALPDTTSRLLRRVKLYK